MRICEVSDLPFLFTKINVKKTLNAPVDKISQATVSLFARMCQMMRSSENKVTKVIPQTQDQKKTTFHGKKDRMLTQKGLTLQGVKGDHRRISKSDICTENKQHQFISCGWIHEAVQRRFLLLNNESGFMSVSAGPKHQQQPDPHPYCYDHSTY